MIDLKKGGSNVSNETKPEKEVEKEVEVSKTKKLKVSDIMLTAIEAVDYIDTLQKKRLLEELTALVSKATTKKDSLKDIVKKMLDEAGEDGITKGDMVNKFMATTPTPTTEQMISFITNLNFFVQPSFYKKEGWKIFTKEGGIYGITKDPTKALK